MALTPRQVWFSVEDDDAHEPDKEDIVSLLDDHSARIDAAEANAAVNVNWKAAVRVATTTTGTWATSYDNGSTVDGVVIATNDRIMILHDADTTRLGIHIVQASGAPVRATDADSNAEALFMAATVLEGSANGGKAFRIAPADGTATLVLGTTALVAQEMPGQSPDVVTKDATQTLTAKTLTAPVINSPTGIVKGDVGLGIVYTKGDSIASAATVNLASATGDLIDITGSDTITSFGNADAGVRRKVRFLGGVTLTHGSDLILPGAANIVAATNDTAEFACVGSNDWVCLWYKRASGKAVVASSKSDVGLGNVDNTSDANKPISSAAQAALDLKAPLASPSLTTPTIAGGAIAGLTEFGIRSTGASFDIQMTSSEELTANRAISWNVVDGARTVKLGGNFEINGNFSLAGAYAATFTLTAATAVTFPTTGTLATTTDLEPIEAATDPLADEDTQDVWLTYRPVDDDDANPDTRTYVFRAPAARDSVVDLVQLFAKASDTFKIKVFPSMSGAATANVSQATGGTGLVEFDDGDFGTIAVPAGSLVSITCPTGLVALTGNGPLPGGYTAVAGDVTTLSGQVATTSNRPQIRVRLRGATLPVNGGDFLQHGRDIAAVKGRLSDAMESYFIGRENIAAGNVQNLVGTYVFNMPAARTGRVIAANFHCGSDSGDLVVRTFTKEGDVFTATAQQQVIAVTGSAGIVSAELDLVINKGEYIGYYHRGNIITYSNTAPDDIGWYRDLSDDPDFEDATVTTEASRLEIGFEIEYYDASEGLETRVSNVEIAIRTLGGETTPMLVVVDSNSLGAGSGGATPWPTQLQGSVGMPLNNQSVSGQTIATMISNAAANIDPILATPDVRPILFVWEYINWLREAGGRTVEDAVDLLEDYCEARRSAGWTRIVVINAIACGSAAGSWVATDNATMIAYNAELASRWADFADALMDVSELNDATNTDLFQDDQIHLETAGQTIVHNKARGIMAAWREF